MFLGQNNQILLSGFDTAFLAVDNSDRLEPVMTFDYMAPEQIKGRPRPASDQYSLGIVVYEWLCGTHPFNGTFKEVLKQHILEPPPSLRKKNPEIPPAVEQVVMIALAKDPELRFKSVQAFATALEQASQQGR